MNMNLLNDCDIPRMSLFNLWNVFLILIINTRTLNVSFLDVVLKHVRE